MSTLNLYFNPKTVKTGRFPIYDDPKDKILLVHVYYMETIPIKRILFNFSNHLCGSVKSYLLNQSNHI